MGWQRFSCKVLALATTFMLLGLTIASGTNAAESSVSEMKRLAEDLLNEATLHYQQVGKRNAIYEFNDTASTRWVRQPYHQHLFALSYPDAIVWADNVFPEFVGHNFSSMTDADGYAFVQDIFHSVEPSKTYIIQIHWLNPESHEVVDSVGACTMADKDNVVCAFTEDDD